MYFFLSTFTINFIKFVFKFVKLKSISFNMSMRLRELIRAVRACKTQAEERAVIAKESALIRTAIKEENTRDGETFRHRNVAKLLFMHMLGYPSHFGQMECLKLIASPQFYEKRIGYLGLCLLLAENDEVLTLVTNSIKLDLNNPSPFICGLALTAVGNLANEDIARDLATDVDKHLKSNNSYLRKKAALTMIRVLKKVPDLLEEFIDRMITLLKDRSHGVLITGLQLLIDVVNLDMIEQQKRLEEGSDDDYDDQDDDDADEDDIEQKKRNKSVIYSKCKRLVPSLVRLLRNVITMGYAPDYDVAGVTDPFLQVKILQLLCVLGTENEETSDAMNEVLAQVATNTETSKNAGNSILYQCVKTIMGVEAEVGLRVLAINILGRFLVNRDNNIRYVALNTLSKVVERDINAVQRHRNTIVSCLKDPDVSIRTRALELIYQLINEANIVPLIEEILNYLVVALPESKTEICLKIIEKVEAYAPSRKWRIDTLVTMYSIAGNFGDVALSHICLYYISVADDLHGYLVHKLYHMLEEDHSQFLLNLVAIWSIGEYGEYLLVDVPIPIDNNIGKVADEDDEAFINANVNTNTRGMNDSRTKYLAISSPIEVLELLEKVAKHHDVMLETKGYICTALLKLADRFASVPQNGKCKSKIDALLAIYGSSMNVDLQQRACEYAELLTDKWSNIRSDILTKIPELDEKVFRQTRQVKMGLEVGGFDADSSLGSPMRSMQVENQQNTDDLDIFGSKDNVGTSIVNSNSNNTFNSFPTSQNNANNTGDLLDLDDIFGGGETKITPPSNHSSQPSNNDLSMLDMFSTTNTNNNNTATGPTATNQTDNSNLSVLQTSSMLDTLSLSDGTEIDTSMSQPAAPTVTAFDKDGLKIIITCSKPDSVTSPGLSILTCTFTNSNNYSINSIVFQCAVPKSVKLEMQPASGNSLQPMNQNKIEQIIKVNNSMVGTKALQLKIKLQYLPENAQETITHVGTVSGFPQGY